ncbi:zinc-binding dehydrogenase [Colletotrichum graminicola M1.001]|uniref:Zinc-binding dehydrogenase n=1 Tax=Colletotrichum graminicola (strain M1.001 / M2 / FGSC 10212) TaxID=645133 RepID=E3QFA1_COLGM|nr:zinc-binding dehydrogenase [Colletotrichum graminicola M1.001]EFQ29539.1 zinc-binding dehydrogenase [Colletotrichum graminicola M1.001]
MLMFIDGRGTGGSMIATLPDQLDGSEVRALRGWGAYDPIVSHEGVGVVVGLGDDTPGSLLDQRVGVKWLYRACGACSRYVVADARYLTRIPRGLGDEEAAPLLCAGLTMMGAVSMLDGDLSRGDWVVIQGAGGGLGHLGVQIASRMKGLRVIAVDAGHEKRMLAESSGAEVYIDYATDDVEKAATELTGEGAHAVIVVPGSEEAYRTAPKLARPMATVVCVGLPHNDFQLPISVTQSALKGVVLMARKLMLDTQALTIKGAMVGTEEQMTELLQEAKKGTYQSGCGAV